MTAKKTTHPPKHSFPSAISKKGRAAISAVQTKRWIAYRAAKKKLNKSSSA